MDPEPESARARRYLLGAASEHCGATRPVRGKRHGRFGQDIVELGLKGVRRFLDFFFPLIAPPVRVKGEQDNDQDDCRIEERH